MTWKLFLINHIWLEANKTTTYGLPMGYNKKDALLVSQSIRSQRGVDSEMSSRFKDASLSTRHDYFPYFTEVNW